MYTDVVTSALDDAGTITRVMVCMEDASNNLEVHHIASVGSPIMLELFRQIQMHKSMLDHGSQSRANHVVGDMILGLTASQNAWQLEILLVPVACAPRVRPGFDHLNNL